MSTQLHIGTSGWHYKHWLGTFYPEKFPASKMFDFYAERFSTVEINNSFYRLPSAETFECWRENSPKDFCFVVKGSRFITHMKKLKDPEEGLQKFFSHAEKLGDKLGPILWQLPPHWHLNLERLEEFLKALPKQHRYSIEFREPSWHCDDVYDLLCRHNVAFCIFELDGFMSPLQITADWSYIRLHGPGAKYQGSYSDDALRQWADFCRKQRKLKDIYIYFDNDQHAYAVRNALTLKKMTNDD